MSALVNGLDASPADPRSETTIWGEGNSNSLVVVLKTISTWRLDTETPDYRENQATKHSKMLSTPP
ncbi:hypothetical protein [Haloarcula halophila]|uniref:hypothetical protein n=1 Tax=Haloarcula TaxID=2237 RepID=UPI00300F91DB